MTCRAAHILPDLFRWPDFGRANHGVTTMPDFHLYRCSDCEGLYPLKAMATNSTRCYKCIERDAKIDVLDLKEKVDSLQEQLGKVSEQNVKLRRASED